MCIDLLEKIKCGPDEFIVVKVNERCSPNRAREISLAMQSFGLHGFIVRGEMDVEKMTREELRRLRDSIDRELKE